VPAFAGPSARRAGEQDHGALDPTCAEIVNRCHHLHLGPGTLRDWHQFAEGNTATMCAARRTECLAVCPADADGAADASGADATGDGAGAGG